MRARIRSTVLPLAVLAALSAATAPGLTAQETDDLCDVLIQELDRKITERWDDLASLDALLTDWKGYIQEKYEFYEPGKLEQLTMEEIQYLKESLVQLRDCLPGMEAAFGRLKKRMEELQNLPEVVGTEDRLRRQRIARFREVEQLHSDVGAALKRILG